jgi:hypothetical protein
MSRHALLHKTDPVLISQPTELKIFLVYRNFKQYTCIVQFVYNTHVGL